jgi:hypothetical protein
MERRQRLRIYPNFISSNSTSILCSTNFVNRYLLMNCKIKMLGFLQKDRPSPKGEGEEDDALTANS